MSDERCEAAEEDELDLRWKADMRAISLWRAKNPGNDLVLPDHTDLVMWMLTRDEERQKAAEELHIKFSQIAQNADSDLAAAKEREAALVGALRKIDTMSTESASLIINSWKQIEDMGDVARVAIASAGETP